MKRPHAAPAPRVRFVCAVLTLALLMPHISLVADAWAAGSKGLPKSAGPAAQTTGEPESNLPSLDEIRQLSPAAPQAPPPVPSTLCSPSNPNCMPADVASNRISDSVADGAPVRPMPADQLAWSPGRSEFVSILGNRVNSVSDSGFALLGEAYPAPARPLASAGSPSPFATQPLMASGVFADDFNDNSRDAAKWSTGAAATGNVVEQNRRLEITPPASATGYNGYFAASTYDLTGGRAAVEVVQAAAPVYGIETHFQLTDNATGNYLLFVTSGGNFAFQNVTNGVMSRVIIPYDASRHRFWRFRHETAGDQLVWETSQDGLVWAAQRRVARPFPLTSLQALLLAGKYTASTPTSMAIFDNLRLEPDPARRVFFADDFDDNARDAVKWNFYGPGSPATAVEQNRRLEITPSPTTTGYNGYQSAAAHDLTDAGIVAEVPQATAGNAETFIALMRDGANSLIIAVSAGSILFQGYTAGVRTRLYIPYDAAQHRFWRIRHDAGADTIVWETSADGVVWVTQRTSPRPFPVTSMTAQLIAGKWTNTGASAPGMALFDNFRLERNAPAYSPSDDFNDNVLDASRWTVVAPASSVTAREQNQRIEFALQPNTAAYNWVSSAQTIDLTSRTLQTEFVQATHQGGSTEAFLKAALDGGNYFHMGASTGYLILDVVIAGARDRLLLTYNPAGDRFLRLRHNHAAHTMSFETSADSKTWATRRVVPVLFPLGALRVELGAGAWATYSSAPGTAVFDNLRLEQNDPNSPPTVGLTAPANGATSNAPANITLTADASDSDGRVAKVEFFQGATKLGEDTVAPYSFTWNGVPAGSYGLTARAMDGDGAVVTSAVVSVTVDAQNGSPAVSITGPANNAQFTAGDAVTLTADASDADGSVTKVEFFQGATKLGEDTTAPYSLTWSNVAAGSYSLTAKATDNYNVPAVTTSNPVNISVVPPSVTVTASDASASEPGTDTGRFTLSRTGSTAAALTVNFAVGGTATGGADYNSLGSSLIIPAGASTATLTVTAVDDAAVEGGETVVLTLVGSAAYTLGSPSSATVTINDNDTLPPTASITSPAGGAIFNAPANITINASAADPDAGGAVVKVEFFGNGVKLGEDTTAPYSIAWNNVAANNYSLTARATDIAGATGTSAPVQIVVNAPPTVTFTAPAAGSVHTAPASITLTANASDADGSVTKVEFFQGTTKLGEDTTAPYSFVWSSVPAGGYTLKAVAIDNRNVATTSAAVAVTVNNPPTVSLSSPANGSTWNAPANIPITANASDAGGSITKVEFYQGATRLGEDTAAPYTFNWNGMAAGSYTLTARATDNLGATTTSAGVGITVNGPPTVSITGPAGGSNFAAGSVVTISAAASDPGGSVSKVEFYNGATKLGEDATAPYSFAWSNVPAGSHALTARATDNNGATATSAAVTVQALDFTATRLDPANRTGGGGADPFSRNFNWSLPLLGLAGRAGLDLGLTLNYNSLVWTKDAAGIGVTFDADRGFPSPGFRLGFPTVQQRFFNQQTQKYAYLLLTPSGGRVELRQVGMSNVYESADSSYLRLTDYGSSLSLAATDGTRLALSRINGEYHCVDVRDRNGNYITINRDAQGHIGSIIDTLGRTVTFNYDQFQNLISITQPWKREGDNGAVIDESGPPHIWATFGYGEALTLGSNAELFNNLAVTGTQGGTQLPSLRQVGLDDGSYYRFEYNAWGQVYRITHYAADAFDQAGQPDFSHPLSSTWLDLPGAGPSLGGEAAVPGQPQGDCPRFTERRDWVENGVLGQSAEVTTGYSEWSANLASCVVTPPDATPDEPNDQIEYQETYGTGWKRGLTTLSEVRVGAEVKKSTGLTWEHDGAEGDSYPTNPRVRQTTVSDSPTNARTTRVEYAPAAEFRLPKKVEECNADCSAVLRTTVIEYDIPDRSEYTNLRIIGLPRFKYLYEGTSASGTLLSKVGYVYDAAHNTADPTDPDFLQALPSAATQHDAGYGTGFPRRGNLNRVRRYDVTGAADTYVESRIAYNVTGSAVLTKDAGNHQTTISYADAFYQGVNRSSPNLLTYAYPTTVTVLETVHEAAPAPLNVVTTTQYNYDLGAAVKTQVPKGGVAQYEAGPEVKTLHDGAGRVRKVLNVATGSYTEWVYPASQTLVQTYTTVKDESVTDPAQRAYAMTAYDGAGRVRGSASDFPGSMGPEPRGNYTGVVLHYDALGRVVFRSNPTEMLTSGSGWVPAGDDYHGGVWRGTTQQYDWMGRPVLTNADGATREVLYGGCGCVGGQVVTTRDELGRRQRVTFDALGRAWKSQTLTAQDKTQPLSHGLDDEVYSTVTNSFNARDQLTQVVEQAGTNGTGQTTTTEYDGHGRVWRTHAPEQDAGRFTTYTYFADDSVQTVTDGRGAKTTYAYNDRHLTTSVSYDLSGVIAGQNVAVTPGVTYQYYADGAIKLMDDGPGSVEYTYDQLGRLGAEKRLFDALGANPYQVTYGYTLAGALKSVKDPWNDQINYGSDNVGRPTSVTGTAFGGVTTYASVMQYRAWGDIKHLDYGNTRNLDITYNSQLRPETFVVAGLMSKRYEYYADGMLRYSQDQLDARFDRSYGYDLEGRVTQAFSGPAARGEADTNNRPYRQTFTYDVWGHLTNRTTKHWSGSGSIFYPSPQPYTNNRNEAWAYDSDGQLADSNTPFSAGVAYAYDAAGQAVTSHSQSNDVTNTYGGDGQRAKTVEAVSYTSEDGAPQTDTTVTFYVHSSVLGGELLSEVGEAGQKRRTFVYAGSIVLAWQVRQAGAPDYVRWEHRDSSNSSFQLTNPAGASYDRAELDPLGNDAGLSNPYPLAGPQPRSATKYPSFGGAANFGKSQCVVDFMERPCSEAFYQVGKGDAGFCPNNNCGPQDFDKDGDFDFLQLTSNGWRAGTLNEFAGAGRPRTPPTLQTMSRQERKRNKQLIKKRGRNPQGVGKDEKETVHIVPLPNLRSGLVNLLNTGDCGAYVQRLFDKAAEMNPGNPRHGKTIMEIYEKISVQGGYRPDAPFYNTVSGDLFVNKGGEPGTVHLLPWRTYGPPSASDVADAYGSYVFGALHETFHLAAKNHFNDEQMMRAAYKIAGKEIPKKMVGSTNVSDWSALFDDELLKHCPKPTPP